MFVCLCRPTREKDLRLAIRAGARDLDAVGRACGAGTRCGTCRPDICRFIAEEARQDEMEYMGAAK